MCEWHKPSWVNVLVFAIFGEGTGTYPCLFVHCEVGALEQSTAPALSSEFKLRAVQRYDWREFLRKINLHCDLNFIVANCMNIHNNSSDGDAHHRPSTRNATRVTKKRGGSKLYKFSRDLKKGESKWRSICSNPHIVSFEQNCIKKYTHS